MEDKLVTVEEFETGFEAELVKVQLEAEGIDAIVVRGELIGSRGIKVELQVFEKDAQKAAQIIAAFEQENESENDIQA